MTSIEELIDSAVEAYEVSGDAMRWGPDLPARTARRLDPAGVRFMAQMRAMARLFRPNSFDSCDYCLHGDHATCRDWYGDACGCAHTTTQDA